MNNIQRITEKRFSDALKVVYQRKSGLEYDIDSKGIVTVLARQDLLIQKLLRKLKVSIPEYSRLTLDELGSRVFLLINGTRSVEDIANVLESESQVDKRELVHNLIVFLNHFEYDLRYIHKV